MEIRDIPYLRLHRKKLKLSKNKLARMSEIAGGDLGQIESGRKVPYPIQMQKIARSLELPEEEAQRLIHLSMYPREWWEEIYSFHEDHPVL